jgi:tetratricopeptide (TPR) repeat protein
MQDRQIADEYFNKFGRSFQEEELAIKHYNLSINSQKLHGVQLAESYMRIAQIYVERTPKSKENFDLAIEYYLKATKVPCPSWFTPQIHAERLALCPDIFGFSVEFRNTTLAEQMHAENLKIQNGGDLIITATDWFGHLLERTEIVNPEYTKVGIKYLDAAIEAGWDNLWMSILYTLYGRAFKFHLEKSDENFATAVSWFRKSIELDVDALKSNQPWTIISRGTSRSYFELAEMYLDPQRFGFSNSPDLEKGNSVYQDGCKHISKYGSLGPYGVLEGMFVDHGRKAFFYKRGEKDIQTIMDLFKLGQSLDKKREGALHMFVAVAYHCLTEKSLNNYREQFLIILLVLLQELMNG